MNTKSTINILSKKLEKINYLEIEKNKKIRQSLQVSKLAGQLIYCLNLKK